MGGNTQSRLNVTTIRIFFCLKTFKIQENTYFKQKKKKMHNSSGTKESEQFLKLRSLNLYIIDFKVKLLSIVAMYIHPME